MAEFRHFMPKALVTMVTTVTIPTLESLESQKDTGRGNILTIATIVTAQNRDATRADVRGRRLVLRRLENPLLLLAILRRITLFRSRSRKWPNMGLFVVVFSGWNRGLRREFGLPPVTPTCTAAVVKPRFSTPCGCAAWHCHREMPPERAGIAQIAAAFGHPAPGRAPGRLEHGLAFRLTHG
jgi:hypothetical protein